MTSWRWTLAVQSRGSLAAKNIDEIDKQAAAGSRAVAGRHEMKRPS
jgi:hypothetical protein